MDLRMMMAGQMAREGIVAAGDGAWLFSSGVLLLVLLLGSIFFLSRQRKLVMRTPQEELHHLMASRKFSRITGAIVVAVGVLVIVGWTFEIQLFKSVLPGLVSMNPATAAGLIFSGIGLVLISLDSATLRQRIAGIVCAMLPLLIGVAKLIFFVTGLDLRVDQILFPQGVDTISATGLNNRMAPNTAFNFALVGSTLLLLHLRRSRAVPYAQGLTLATGLLSILALIGYFYGARPFYGVASFIPMALHTATSFLLLSLGLLWIHPGRGVMAIISSDGPGGSLARRLLPACIIVPALFGWMSQQGVHANLYSVELGVSLNAVANIVFFMLLIWWNAGLLYQADRERRKTIAALEASEIRHRTVVQQAAEGIYLVDIQTHRVVEVNPALAKLLGYSVEELTGAPIYTFIDDTPENVDSRLQRVLDSPTPLRGERRYRRKDGSIADVSASATVIEFGGKQMLSTVVHDISERKRAQRVVEEKNRELQEAWEAQNKAYQALQAAQSQLVQAEKLAGLGQMVAGVAHEINNPLSFVSNNVAVLQRDLAAVRKLLAMYQSVDPELEKSSPQTLADIRDLSEQIDLPYTLGNLDELLLRSREGLRRIQQIVKDLRDFARLDEGDLKEADLNSGIESTANIILGRAKKKQVTLDLKLQPLPAVTCFPAKINQVVMNLMSNAIDASPPNGVVTVSTKRDGDQVQIAVADTGSGIPQKIMDRIFDPFFTTKKQGEGTGLGLSISFGIIKEHGGRIEVESEVGKGSRFTIHLPIEAVIEKKG